MAAYMSNGGANGSEFSSASARRSRENANVMPRRT
jgi:hypothetical protein